MSDLSTDALHMTSPLRVGRRVGRTIYAQLGPEPSDSDPLVATADSPVLAERIVRAVNAAPPLGEEDVPRNVFDGRARDVARVLGDAVEDDDVPRWADLMGRVRELARRPAQPAVAPDTLGAAPTRDPKPLVEAEETTGGLWCAMSTIGGRRTSIYAAHDGAHIRRVVRDINVAHGERVGSLKAAVLSGGGADGGGEDEDVEPRCGAYHPEYGFTCRDLPKGHGRWHWDQAGGYWDHDGQHIDGMVREPEALDPTTLANENGELRGGTSGLAEWRHGAEDRVVVDRDRRVVVWPARGAIVADADWLSRAVLSAKRWADAHLEVGDEVTGSRAVSAPVGTTLGAKSAAVAAVHTVNGWSVTGMNHEQDHEEHVRINQWVVLALTEAGETGG